MKWTYLYGETKYPYKEFNQNEFAKLVNTISDLNREHISGFIKEKEINKAFQVLYYQQFYLQRSVTKENLATQVKLFATLAHKSDLEASFLNKTGLSIVEFLRIIFLVFLITQANKLGVPQVKFYGFLSSDHLAILSHDNEERAVSAFFRLLMFDSLGSVEKIKEFKRGITKEEFQLFETTFFTLFPFQLHDNKIRLVHQTVLNYTINYYLYDYLKANDPRFGAEFGKRFEKYIDLSLREMNISFKTENDLKVLLGKTSTVTDFMLEKESIFIESKAIELQPFVSINPSDDSLYNSLKDCLIKAYCKQLLHTAKQLRSEKENWGLIITYKQLFWSRFSDVWNYAKQEVDETLDQHILPIENVFILVIFTWNKLVHIVRDQKATLIEILVKARESNQKSETSKQLFEMHLDEYNIEPLNLSFLEDEFAKLPFA